MLTTYDHVKAEHAYRTEQLKRIYPSDRHRWPKPADAVAESPRRRRLRFRKALSS